MKTIINASIVFESDVFGSYMEDISKPILTISELVKLMKKGNYEVDSIAWNELMTDPKVYLFIRHKS